MSNTVSLLPFVVPALPLAAGLFARMLPVRAQSVTVSAAGAAVLAAVLLAVSPKADAGWVRLDSLALTMSLLVSFLGSIVLRFASRYLEGDGRRAGFLSWMSLALGSVLTLVVSNHLLLLLGAWISTSLCLHRLLLHNPGRAGAVYAARKKWVYSRIADLSLLSASVLLFNGHGTWKIDELISSISAGHTAGLPAAAFLLALCAMLKSAQFPFHSWLPDTMDTPTPVSAFMHAGIINGGGFLILRMAPVFTAAPSAMWTLAAIGTFTSVFGAIVMLAQPSVKRSLAFSTIAQMGFMMVQCGFGAWGLALLHLVAHSLYKAYAFLRAGSTIGVVPRAAIPLSTPALAMGALAGIALVALASTGFHLLGPESAPTPIAFMIVLALSLAYGIARSRSGHPAGLPRALGAAAGIALIALALHFAAGCLLPEPVPPAPPTWLVAMICVAFVGLFLFQALLWRASAHPLGHAFYVHALNGFYIGAYANRLLNRLWPSQPAS